ncbi:MAG: hypothetical protein AAB425_03155 [Bdellovibrionota bacterium]|mgnify:CR=1 FL=1
MRLSRRSMALSLIAVLVAAVSLGIVISRRQEPQINSIHAYFPFGFSKSTDPRSIFSVGDQVLSEHLFGFHSQRNFKGGFFPVLSKVDFEYQSRTIRVTPRFPLKRSDGSTITFESVCNSLKESFKGTEHAPFGTLLKEIKCLPEGIEIAMNAIPVNMQALFSLPDFSLFDVDSLPITHQSPVPTTGPYSVRQLESSKAVLVPNAHYPSELTANQIPEVTLEKYQQDGIADFLKSLNPDEQHLLYFQGHALSDRDVKDLEAKAYRIEIFPDEWLAHLGFQPDLSEGDRHLIAAAIEEKRNEFQKNFRYGQAAFSIPPVGRSFAILESEHAVLAKREVDSKRAGSRLSKRVVIGALDYMARIPVIAMMLDTVKQAYPDQVSIKVIPKSEFMKLYEEGVDVYTGIQGISAADPAHHLAFFLKNDAVFAEAITQAEIIQLSTLQDADAFNRMAHALELKLLEKRVIVPIMHFPGIVASAPRFERDDRLAGSWGIQAWTYRVR